MLLVTMHPNPGGDERETAGEELFAISQVASSVAAALELPQHCLRDQFGGCLQGTLVVVLLIQAD